MPQVYEPEFKRKLVRLHLEEGRSYKSLTQEYGVSKSAISKCVELFSNECQKKVNADPTALNDADLMKENLRLRTGGGTVGIQVSGVNTHVSSSC